MTKLIDQVTKALTEMNAPFYLDQEKEVLMTNLPTNWSRGQLMLKSDDDLSIDLLALVGGKVPHGALSMVEETLQQLNGYCKYARFELDRDHSRIVLHTSCPLIGGFQPEPLIFLMVAMASYCDRFNYAIESVIRENTTPEEAVRVVVNC